MDIAIVCTQVAIQETQIGSVPCAIQTVRDSLCWSCSMVHSRADSLSQYVCFVEEGKGEEGGG